MTGNLISPVVVIEKVHSSDGIVQKQIVDCDFVALLFMHGIYTCI